MAGYTRQSTADIIPTATVRAAPLNAEYNALRDAFAASGGHKHDGTAAEGEYVPLIADVDAKNKVAIDTSNNRVGVFVEVSSAAVEQVRFQDGAIVPVTDSDIDLGTSTLEFKDLFLDGTAHIDTADIDGGSIDNTSIGSTTAASGAFSTLSATSGIIGDVTGNLDGNVTGNVTGNIGGNVTGNVAGDLTGNVTASSGVSTFNDLTVNGTLDVTGTTIANVTDPASAQDAATKNYVDTNDALKLNLSGGTMSGDIAMGSNTVSGLAAPSADGDAATKLYVDTSVANVIDAAPAALDTLNELAAALGDDAAFSTTVTNSIATKLPLAGGTMTGDLVLGTNKATSTATPATADTLTRKGYVDTQDALKLNLAGGTMSGDIAMGTSKVTGLGDPVANQDAATKTYVDTQRDTRVAKSGDTMSGNLAMGNNSVTGLTSPSAGDHAVNKTYIDTLYGSTAAAATSAANALTSANTATTKAGEASTSATSASSSATDAQTAQTGAEAALDEFTDLYLGSKSTAPAVDNDGNALATGAIYWNTVSNQLYIWDGSAWDQAAFNTTGAVTSFNTRQGAVVLTEADVTAAGALMDSEVTNLAQVKAFATTDYATAAQGALADSALQSFTETSHADVVVDADIGVTVQAYDANIVSDATYVATANDFTTVLKGKIDAIDQGVATTDSPTFVNITATSTSYADGTAAAPSVTFTNDTDTGLYLSGTNSIGISTAGTEAVTFDGSGSSTAMQVLSNDGLTTLLNIDETTDDLLQVINSSDTVLFEVSNTTGVAIAANTAVTGTFGVTGATTVTGALTVSGDTLVITTAKTPASATAAGIAGQIAWDTGYIYICTATNTWERVAVATW